MKNFLFVFLFIISIAPINAQDFTYEDIVDDPQDIKFAQIGIGIWDMDINDYNLQIWNLNPRLYVQYSKLFSVEAEYIRALADRFYPSSADNSYNDGNSVILKSKYNSESARKASIIGTYYFKNSTREKDVTYHLKQEGNVAYVSSIPSQVLTSFGLRLGYTQGSTFYTLPDNLLTDLQRLDIPGQFDNPLLNSETGSTMVDYSYFRVGLSMTKVYNKEFNTDKYGKKEYQDSNFWYLDLFINTKFEADDMYYNNYNGSSTGFDLELYPVSINYREKLPVGGCIGYRSENVSGHGFGYGAELGLVPGFNDAIISNVYLRINVSYQFAVRF